MTNHINIPDLSRWREFYYFADYAEMLRLLALRIPENTPFLFDSAVHKPSTAERPP